MVGHQARPRDQVIDRFADLDGDVDALGCGLVQSPHPRSDTMLSTAPSASADSLIYSDISAFQPPRVRRMLPSGLMVTLAP